MSNPEDWFPGGTSVSRLRVYDWPAADGQCGGSPHLHTASAEGYVVTNGTGALETLSGAGYAKHPLRPGVLLWFTPGTVHRLVTFDGELEILVVMQNSGLPEAGDAVLTFPPEVLRDAAAYAHAATVGGAAEAARRRRDLAIEGYLDLRERVLAEGPRALDGLYRAATALVRQRVRDWLPVWRDRTLAQALQTGRQLNDLARGRGDHLASATVYTADDEAAPRFGMCGPLGSWHRDEVETP
jgi:hypothetical protein